MCCFCGCCSNWNGMCWYIQTFLPIHTHLLLHRLSLLKCTFELVLEKFRIFVMETWSLNRRLNANPIKSLTFMKPYYKYSRSQLWEILSVSFCEGIKKKKNIFWCVCSWNSTSVVSKMFLNQSSFTLDNLTNNRLTELFCFLWHISQTGSLSPLLAQLVLLPLVTFTAHNRPALLSTRPSSLLTDLIIKIKKTTYYRLLEQSLS